MEPSSLSISAYGLRLHALDRNPAGSPTLLFLHGWLDHARSFDWVCDKLPDAYRMVALDFRGHGQSEHISPGASYYLVDHVADVNAAADALATPVHLVGHSMGGVVALMFAAARPEKVASLTLLESLGPNGGPPERALERLREFVDELGKVPRKRAYSTVEDAALKLRENNPGLSAPVALHLARYGTRGTDSGLLFSFDPSLRRKSGMIYDEEQLASILGAVKVPVQIVRASRGYPFDEALMRSRLEKLGNPKMVTVDGGHHVHLDRPAEVALAVQAFVDAHRG